MGTTVFAFAAAALVWIAPGSQAPAAERGVRIVADNRFDPKDKFIEAGDTVVWTYDDANGVPHSVTRTTNPERFDSSPSNCPQTNPLEQSDCLDSPGDSYSHRFDTPGNYPYFCKVHGSSMSGVIHVAAKPTASVTPTPTATRSASPSPSPSPTGSGSLSPGATPVPTSSPGPTQTPTPAPSESPLPPRDGGGSGGKAALAVLALAALGGAGALIYKRFLA